MKGLSIKEQKFMKDNHTNKTNHKKNLDGSGDGNSLPHDLIKRLEHFKKIGKVVNFKFQNMPRKKTGDYLSILNVTTEDGSVVKHSTGKDEKTAMKNNCEKVFEELSL